MTTHHTYHPFAAMLILCGFAGCAADSGTTPQNQPPVIEQQPAPTVKQPDPIPAPAPEPEPAPTVHLAILPPWFEYCTQPPCLPYTVDGHGILVASWVFTQPLSIIPVPMDFPTITQTSPLARTVFYVHPDIPEQAGALHASTNAVIAEERRITGTTSEYVTAIFVPSELAQFFYEGNVSWGNGTITINYGNAPYINALGGLLKVAEPEIAHEYAHELFNEIVGFFPGYVACLNEGIADALGYQSGFLPLQNFGPAALKGGDFRVGPCSQFWDSHDLGNCYFWHLYEAGELTEPFWNHFFHPTRRYDFNSCDAGSTQTGDTLRQLFSDAAGHDLRSAVAAMGIPQTL